MNFKNSTILNFPKLFNSAFGAYKLQIIAIAILSFINSIFEGIGISTLIPIFSFVAKDGAKGTDIISTSIEKFFTFLGITYSLRNLFIFVAILFVSKIVILFLTKYITAFVVAQYEKNTRASLFNSMLKSDWSYLSKQKLGHLDQIMTINLNNTSSLFFVFSAFVLIVAKIIIYTIIAIQISSIIALLALVVGLIAFLVFKPFFHKTKIISEELEILNRDTSHYTNENILGMKTVKSSLAELSVFKKANAYFEKKRILNMKYVFIQESTNVIIQFFAVGFVLVMFTFMYKVLEFNFAIFAVIVYAINQIFLEIQSAQYQMHRISERVPYLSKLLSVLGEAKKYIEKSDGKKDFSFKKEISFNNLFFKYETGKNVLDNLNFNIKKGEMVGLIGPSGAGKTTIVDLLLRFYNLDSGDILIDGKSIKDISLEEWRKNIGYISQDIFLMNDTIENNIRFYNPSLTQKDIEEASKQAQIYDFIQTMPEKFNTVIGERGILLSVGQRQRIIIARVLAKKPELLILDEATSALDNESEFKIQEIIENLKGSITVLVIAHRLSTIINSDKLVILENGKITETGTPKDLLENKKSYFAKVYNLRT